MERREIAPLDDFGRSYLRLVLEIDKHIDGYIDAYYGPAALKAAVQAGGRRPPAALLEDLANLQAAIPTADPARHAYLTATLRALDCTLRTLNGEAFAYLEEVNRLYDITPDKVDETQFMAAHRELDGLLPGSGRLNDRIEAHRRHYYLQRQQILPLLELARAETRQRTATFVDLPADESVEIRLTHNQPWGAYNWYLGHGRSLVEFNTDVPVSALGLISTFAHEGYPGHHTESLLKENHLYRHQGYAEQAAMLLHSPAAVIAEAVATTAIEIIFPGDSHHLWNVEVMLPAAEIEPAQTAAEMARIARALKALRHVGGNAAILYHNGRQDREQSIDYIRTYSLATRQRAEKTFSFLSHPLYRSYPFTYTEGYDLIEQAAPGGNKGKVFGRLLTEQILPSQLAVKA